MALSDYSSELIATAQSLASPGKGILAVDESTKTIGKRLGSIGVENTEANRQAYRGMLFTTAGLGEFISGAILYEETLFQNHADGESMVSKLGKLGIIPGIKVDKAIQYKKWEAQQEHRPGINNYKGKELENVFIFKYLATLTKLISSNFTSCI